MLTEKPEGPWRMTGTMTNCYFFLLDKINTQNETGRKENKYENFPNIEDCKSHK